MAKFGYKRVSTKDQTTIRQDLPDDIPHGGIFEEYESGGSRKERSALRDLLKIIRSGDEVFVYSID